MDRRTILNAGAAALVAAGTTTGCATGAVPRTAAVPLPRGAVGRLAFASCLDQTKPQPIWNAVLEDRPELFVFGGDNVYASDWPWQADSLRNAYALLQQSDGFARLRARVPALAIWDDHDYGSNDAGAEFAHKQASKDEFLDFWQIPSDDPRRSRPALYHSALFGPPGQRLQVIVLDGRWFRSPLRATDRRNAPGRERYLPDPDPAKTMLGEVQWDWLREQLLQPADLRLVVSGVQVLAEGHGWECWGNLPGEQDRLLALLRETRARGVLFLSGDRHIGAFYRHQRSDGYPLFEMTSSGMTHAWARAREAGPNRLGELVTRNHYGLVDVDWVGRRVSLALKDEQGVVQQRLEIALSDLA